MGKIKRWIPLFFLVFSLFIFSACNSEALIKPTGLESDPIVNALEIEDAVENVTSEDAIVGETNIETEDVEIIDEVKVTYESEEPKEEILKIMEDEKSVNTEKQAKTENKTEVSNDVTKTTNKSSTTNNKHEPSKNITQKQPGKSKNERESSNSKTNVAQQQTDDKKDAKKTATVTQPKAEKTNETKKDTVTISIVINSSEVPLSSTVQEIEPGDTVLDVFYKVTRKYGIQQSVRGSGGNAYIEGIANVYEFDRGPGSGWMYSVNGIFPDRSVGIVPVQDGDRIQLLYTLDLGKDINANLQPFRR